jgi:hypothetical protein
MIRVLQGSLRMPVSSFVFPFFVMFGGGTVGVRGKFMLLGGSTVAVVCVVHCVFSCGKVY